MTTSGSSRRFLRGPDAVAGHPVHLGRPRPPRRRPGQRRMARRSPACHGLSRGGDLGDGQRGLPGPARGLWLLARRRPRRPGGLRLRAPRCAARGAARRVGLAAVRAGAAGWPAAGQGRLRRQGAGDAAHPRRPGLPGGGRRDRPAGHHQAADRGRGRVRLAPLRRPPAGAGRPPRLRRGRGVRHHDVGRRRAVHVHRDARAGDRGDHAARPGLRPAFRLLRRRGAQPPARDGRAARGPA